MPDFDLAKAKACALDLPGAADSVENLGTLYTGDGYPRTFALLVSLLRNSAASLEAACEVIEAGSAPVAITDEVKKLRDRAASNAACYDHRSTARAECRGLETAYSTVLEMLAALSTPPVSAPEDALLPGERRCTVPGCKVVDGPERGHAHGVPVGGFIPPAAPVTVGDAATLDRLKALKKEHHSVGDWENATDAHDILSDLLGILIAEREGHREGTHDAP